MNPAYAQAVRCSLGLARAHLAEIFALDERSVRRWETDGHRGPPVGIARQLDAMMRARSALIERYLDIAETGEPVTVPIYQAPWPQWPAALPYVAVMAAAGEAAAQGARIVYDSTLGAPEATGDA